MDKLINTFILHPMSNGVIMNKLNNLKIFSLVILKLLACETSPPTPWE